MLHLYIQEGVRVEATYTMKKRGSLTTVIDNHKHGYPPALFSVKVETGDMITEALQLRTATR